MRRRQLKHLAETLKKEEPDTRLTDERSMARALIVQEYGPKTAAWLIFGHRKQFHQCGAHDFNVPLKPTKVIAEKLRWFWVAMDYLMTRDGWSVQVRTSNDTRTFRVKWHAWQFWKNRALTTP